MLLFGRHIKFQIDAISQKSHKDVKHDKPRQHSRRDGYGISSAAQQRLVFNALGLFFLFFFCLLFLLFFRLFAARCFLGSLVYVLCFIVFGFVHRFVLGFFFGIKLLVFFHLSALL